MEPDETWEAEKSDDDSTGREQDHESQAGHDTVCNHDCLGLLKVSAEGHTVATESRRAVVTGRARVA